MHPKNDVFKILVKLVTVKGFLLYHVTFYSLRG